MNHYIAHRLSVRNLIFFTALLLVSCFLLHAIEFDHHHPAYFGHGIQAALHGDDRKRLMLAVLIAALLIFFFRSNGIRVALAHPESHLRPSARKAHVVPSLFDPIRIALRKGIVHPKVYDPSVCYGGF